MCKRCLSYGALVVCALFCAANSARAANTIPIVNGGFEDPPVDQTYGTTLNGTPITGWNVQNITEAGLWNPSIDSFGGGMTPAPEGSQLMYIGSGEPNSAEQQLDQVLAPNASYTLTGWAGDFLGYPATWTAELTAGGHVLAQTSGTGPDGDTAPFTINFNSAGSAYVGQVLQIVLMADNTQSVFDGIKLTTSAPVVAGDLNADGVVNQADYAILTSNWLKNADFLAGDLNHDGTVNLFDFGIFKNDYHLANGANASALAAPVPEPTTCLLAMMALPLLAWGSRRVVRNKTERRADRLSN